MKTPILPVHLYSGVTVSRASQLEDDDERGGILGSGLRDERVRLRPHLRLEQVDGPIGESPAGRQARRQLLAAASGVSHPRLQRYRLRHQNMGAD